MMYIRRRRGSDTHRTRRRQAVPQQPCTARTQHCSCPSPRCVGAARRSRRRSITHAESPAPRAQTGNRRRHPCFEPRKSLPAAHSVPYSAARLAHGGKNSVLTWTRAASSRSLRSGGWMFCHGSSN
eukprot:6815784-Prymnesium_polylepis.1